MRVKNLKNLTRFISNKAIGAFFIGAGFLLPAFADSQILSGAASEMNTNFNSSAYIWGIFLIADIVIAFGMYAPTKKPSVFWSTFIILMIIKVAVTYIINTYFPTTSG